jgi:hypothetical protein
MNSETGADLQQDDELEATPERAAAVFAESLLKDTHTCLPGKVLSFDATKQTAQVQPLIQRLFVGDGAGTGWVDLPPCVDVPVQFPAGGPFVLTFPVAAGDECLLVFSERAIDFWWDRGGVQQPSEVRMHDLSDAFAIVGVSSKPRFIGGDGSGGPPPATDATELRTRDGTVILRVDATGINLNSGTAGVARLGDSTQLTLSPADQLALADAMLATGLFTPSGSPPSTPPPLAPFIGGQITQGSGTVKAGD